MLGKKITQSDVKVAKAILEAYKSQNTGKKQSTKSDGLSWWTKRGFTVQKEGLKVKASNGKTYPAVKGIDKNGKTITLLATRNGAIYTKQF